MTSLRFLLVSLFAAVAAGLGVRRKPVISHGEWTYHVLPIDALDAALVRLDELPPGERVEYWSWVSGFRPPTS